MADLNAITLAEPILSTDGRLVKLSSITNVRKDDYLVVVTNGRLEAMAVLDATSNPVRVMRGVAGTAPSRYVRGATVYTGAPNLFHSADPHGIPLGAPVSNPYINLRDGRIWVAQGDAVGAGVNGRWWQLQSSVYAPGALGILVAPAVTP